MGNEPEQTRGKTSVVEKILDKLVLSSENLIIFFALFFFLLIGVSHFYWTRACAGATMNIKVRNS
jgi:hypothetical protein